MSLKKYSSTVSLLALLYAAPAFAEEAPDFSEHMTGDWGGARTTLAQKGIDIEAIYKVDFWSNTSGGIKEGVKALDNLDVIATFDGEKLWHVPGNTVMVHFLNNHGGQPNERDIGSIQGVDNIEVGEPTGKLYQLWMEQKLLNEKVSVKAGLYDLNTEFNVIPSGGVFLHPVYGTSAELAATGENGPSVFPNTGLAFRVFVEPTESWYAGAAVIDGVPGDPEHPHGTHIHLSRNEGALWIGEAGYKIPGAGEDATPLTQISVGGWRYTKKADDLIDTTAGGDPVKRYSQGGYVMIDQSLYQEQDKEQGLRGFARFGVTDGDVNPIDYAWSAGLVYVGLVPNRDKGITGISVHQAHLSDKLQRSLALSSTATDSAETGVELTYRDNILPWLAVQPDVQYISNPGAVPEYDDSVLMGMRFTVTF